MTEIETKEDMGRVKEELAKLINAGIIKVLVFRRLREDGGEEIHRVFTCWPEKTKKKMFKRGFFLNDEYEKVKQDLYVLENLKETLAKVRQDIREYSESDVRRDIRLVTTEPTYANVREQRINIYKQRLQELRKLRQTERELKEEIKKTVQRIENKLQRRVKI